MDEEMSEESAACSQAVTPLISQRIVSVDFYSQPPNYLFDQVKNDFNNTEMHWVPVIRIFGATTGGQKTCAHIHGVFPYMYVPALPTVNENELAESIDEALNRTSTMKNKDNFKHVMQIVKVKGRSYYGYHNSEEGFFKIHFYTPFSLTKAAQLLANGSIMGLRMQPHESHIPYILQFFIDYNLFGMNLIHYNKVLFRRNEGQNEFVRSFVPDEPRKHWSYDEMGEHLFQPETVKRSSRCELEFDVLAHDILNRFEKRSRNSNPGIGAIWQDEMERRRQSGVPDWANIPIPVSQERNYRGEIFEAEQSYRKILLRKLEPFSYLSQLSQDVKADESMVFDLLPASQAECIIPQEESQVSFSAKSSQSQELDDDSVLRLFEQMAEEVRKEEAHYHNHSVLHSEEFEDIEETNDSQKVVLMNGGEEAVEDVEDEVWSKSFMSQTLEDLNIPDSPPSSPAKTGSARTDAVRIVGTKTERLARRDWNDEILESLMKDITSNKVPRIDLENPCPPEDEISENVRSGEAPANEPAKESAASKTNKLTQAQKMFPCVMLRRESITSKDEPSSSQESEKSEMSSTEEKIRKNTENDSVGVQIEKFAVTDSQHFNSTTYNGEPESKLKEYPSFSKTIALTKAEANQKPKSSSQTEAKYVDFECQTYPETASAQVQANIKLEGVEVGTSTDNALSKSCGTQTDAGTLDVIRTCGCRCNCGLMSMAALRANWEMAEKNKDRSCQTDEDLNTRPHKRSKFDQSVGNSCPGDNSRHESGSPHVSKRKGSRTPIEADPRQYGVTIKPTELSPRKIAKLQERSSRSPRTSGSQRSPNINSNLKIFDGSQKIRKQNWEWTISNPAKFSPQFDAVTKLLKKQGQSAKRRITSPESSAPVRPRVLDMSITSVHEFESPETTDLKIQRLKAAKRGLRLFEFKHQQMLSTQRENAERRRERKELRDRNLLTKFSIREIVRPFKRTPQESFIAELVERDEKAALPDSPDYYADRPKQNDQEEEGIDKPQAVRFKGGNMSEDEDDSPGTPMSLSSPAPCVNGISSQHGYKTPVLKPASGSTEGSPRSILKSSRSKGRRSTQLKRRSIRWGIQTPEQMDTKKSEATGSGSGELSLYNADISELDGPTPVNPYNAYLNVSNLQAAKALHLHQYITTMCVEVFCVKRCPSDDLKENTTLPDPLRDEVIGIFYSIHEDKPENNSTTFGMLAVDLEACSDLPFSFPSRPGLQCSYFADEISMFNKLLAMVREYDPDILVGYEICKMSWGYLIERGHELGIPMVQEMSRLIPRENKKKQNDMQPQDWNEVIHGRIVLNLWRLLRHEMTVQSYTFESAMFNIMHEKVGTVSHLTLNKFWNSEVDRFRTVDFFCRRVQGVMEIIDKLDLINRTCELARLFGIQFFEVFSRGSQFRVESMMLRLVKPDNMIAASPTVSQRAVMRAPTELPLIMEPESKLYTDPVAVLDFQSLYPSMMIAYNYDFSTCLGRVEHLGSEGRFVYGCLDLQVSPTELSRLMAKNEIHISPCGVAFLKSSVKRGILPEMLEQILDTRQMVKRSMKTYSDNKTLQKVLDSRQLGLKLIANVTYGYTSANFSGRMPCVEIADSVVSKGRETLERAIKLVQANEERWGARVIYGDTDSMFVLFPNRTREKAFELAQDIADEVTQMNPKPVKLKLEKIYQPCILQTKKRYVGFSYESPQQVEPKYDAKGIETVRRDGCPAIAKILEKSLRIMFTTNDEHRLRQYLEAQFQKILLGNVNLSDFTFAREYRGRSGYRPGAVVPALAIADRLRQEDRRAEPQAKERVPYVVIFGSPNQTLINQIRTPREFVENGSLRINSVYYIERAIIPPLNRCFLLAGIDVQKWYAEIPRRQLRMLQYENRQSRGVMDYFLVSKNCVSCDLKTDDLLCNACKIDPLAFIRLQREADVLSRKVYEMSKTCEYCVIGVCISLDCQTWQKMLRYDKVQESRLELLRRALNYFHHWND